MNRLLIVRASLVGALLAFGCSGGTGGPAGPPFDPFGTDPVPPTGPEPTGGGGLDTPTPSGRGNTIPELCAYDCMRLEAACPGSSGGPTCASDCVTSASMFPNCSAELRTFLSCVATAPLVCNFGNLEIPACEGAAAALQTCIQAAAP